MDWIDGASSVVVALSTAATALVAVLALRSTARDSRERSRPMVLAEFRKAEHSTSHIDLIVRNAGPSVARQVQVSFDPEPVLPSDVSTLRTPYLLRRYREPIPSMSPGQEFANIWFSGTRPPDGETAMVNREPTPDNVTVRVTYRDSQNRRYFDEFPLELDLIRLTTFATSSTSIPGRFERIDRSLSKIADSMSEVANVARLTWGEEDD